MITYNLMYIGGHLVGYTVAERGYEILNSTVQPYLEMAHYAGLWVNTVSVTENRTNARPSFWDKLVESKKRLGMNPFVHTMDRDRCMAIGSIIGSRCGNIWEGK